MPLNESEELEMLELERERSQGVSAAPPKDKKPFSPMASNAVDRLKEYPQNLREGLNKVGDGWVGENIDAPVGAAVRTVSNAAGEFIPEPIKKASEWVGKKFMGTPGVKQVADALPESTKYNLGTTAQIAGLATAKPGFGLAGEIAKPLTSLVAKGVERAAETMGTGLQKGSARIQGTQVKINTPEFKKGAQNEMYTKHEVFGNAKDVRGQWQNKIEDVSSQVKEKIQNQPDIPENYASLDDIFKSAKESAAKYGGSRTDVIKAQKAIDDLQSEFEAAYPEGRMDLVDAQAEKQAAGHKGDWYSVAGQVKTDPALASTGKAYNALYAALKTTVEGKGAPGIKELNKQLSEFILMERAARKQMLINSRKNLIPLDVFIGGLHSAVSAGHGNFLPALLTVATLGTRSPLVAKGLNSVGKFLRVDTKAVPKMERFSLHTPEEKAQAIEGLQAIKPRIGTFRNVPIFQSQIGPPKARNLLAGKTIDEAPARLPEYMRPQSPLQLEPPGKYSDFNPGFTISDDLTRRAQQIIARSAKTAEEEKILQEWLSAMTKKESSRMLPEPGKLGGYTPDFQTGPIFPPDKTGKGGGINRRDFHYKKGVRIWKNRQQENAE
jgi:hypothetical protein